MTIHVICSCGKQAPLEKSLTDPGLTCSGCGKLLSISYRSEKEVEKITRTSGDEPYWAFPSESSDNLIVLDSNAIHIAELKPDEVNQAIDALNADQPASETVQASNIYAYETISQVECNLRGTMVCVTTKAGDSIDNHWIELHDVESRDQFLESVKCRLASDWQNEVEYYSRMNAAGAPLLALFVLGAILAFVVWAANAPGPDADQQRLKVIRGGVFRWIFVIVFSCFGWIGVGCGVGLVIMITTVWLTKRVANPPIEWRLKPNVQS